MPKDITPKENYSDLKENCRHPEHNFPSMLLIPKGKVMEHICPKCGKRTIRGAKDYSLDNKKL